MSDKGHILRDIPTPGPEEAVDILLNTPGARIERIVSHGHSSPPGFWYDQPGDEWVVVLQGCGEVLFEGDERPHRLEAGDFLFIKSGQRHRVAYTAPDQNTVWMAVHLPPAKEDGTVR